MINGDGWIAGGREIGGNSNPLMVNDVEVKSGIVNTHLLPER